MESKLAFVLGGGGARGALQVGALQALLEAGYQPDLLVGTSVGAVNASFIAINGFNQDCLDRLSEAWHAAVHADLLPANYLWLTVRSLFRRPDASSDRMRSFFISHGLSPDLRFRDLKGIELVLVSTDLNSGSPCLYGVDLQQSILEGLLASTALPPWVAPVETSSLLLIDGGIVSTLPVEPALRFGAAQVIALDLFDPRLSPHHATSVSAFFYKLMMTVEQRQVDLELALAEARGVPTLHIPLRSGTPMPLWNFHNTEKMIAEGYEIAQSYLASWPSPAVPEPKSWLDQLKTRFHFWG
jgi:NTE family protein